MKITRVSTAVVAGNFPWVQVKIETDSGVTGLGEAPGHGMTLNEVVVREHLKPGSSFFGDSPHA
jgi:L-alanine-DL-glutamate epimerase-like enolase superfamily enzyme